jgi:hypothetical protein
MRRLDLTVDTYGAASLTSAVLASFARWTAEGGRLSLREFSRRLFEAVAGLFELCF